MPHVEPGLIAVVTNQFPYTPTDADGKPVGETVTYMKGDVIHDEALVKLLHDRHFHHSLAPTVHHEHLCPEDCATLKAAKLAAKPAPASAVPVPFASAVTLAATISTASAAEVK